MNIQIMKRTIFIVLISILVVFSSCKKDDDINPDNLAGTEWKSLNTDYDDEEYYLFKFTSKTIVELWIKNEGDPKLYEEMDGIYSITGSNITIDFGYEDITGVIEGKTMSFASDGSVVVFTKQ